MQKSMDCGSPSPKVASSHVRGPGEVHVVPPCFKVFLETPQNEALSYTGRAFDEARPLPINHVGPDDLFVEVVWAFQGLRHTRPGEC